MQPSLVRLLKKAALSMAVVGAGSLLLFSSGNSDQSSALPPTSKPFQFQPSDIKSPAPKGVDAQSGFRMQRYRSAVPAINPGTEVVNTERAFQLYQSGAVNFVDVYPPRGLGADPLDGSWIISESHENIQGSTWLPEVGRGHLESGHIDYFKRNLQVITHGNKASYLLFYCTADCWQSWNAARRALLWGYTNIFWYPDGTDGWLEEEHTVVPAQPVNFLGE